MKAALLRVGIAVLWVPCAIFWLFAAWRSRLQTMLENERARNDYR